MVNLAIAYHPGDLKVDILEHATHEVSLMRLIHPGCEYFSFALRRYLRSSRNCCLEFNLLKSGGHSFWALTGSVSVSEGIDDASLAGDRVALNILRSRLTEQS